MGKAESRPPDHERILQAMPWACRLARKTAREIGVKEPHEIEECEQVACQALVEGEPGYDPSQGPFENYVWQRVVGAVIRHVNRWERPRRAGLDDALAVTQGLRDTSDPLDDDDADARAQLMGYCREVSLARGMGDGRAALSERPEDVVLRAQIFDALHNVLGALNEEEKQFLTLHYWGDIGWTQMAILMGKDEKQIRRMDGRLRERLRRGLKERKIDGPPPRE